MPLNPDELLGRVLTSDVPYLVGREKVREFARAVFATHPIHFDPEVAVAAGYRDVVAPATFAGLLQEHVREELFLDPDAGIELKRVVHGDQQFIFNRQIVAGDVLTAELEITRIRSLGANSMLTAETRIIDEEGELVVTALSSLVVRGDD
ncbi:MaoC family dehydratase [Agromyces protaetiae]|uniref:UPF0336 protein ET445_01500 n=1 Tax=Agromyces protaetiae TaxID=2509455 RepID=A0A4P6FCX8_9MICO|nr:MaoC family dehydratase N-terminal domain-containing protein [Agromyces protaetiae]QAY72209.1 MaoC family dehydratase [Agromyces protaetiae]